MPNCRDICPLTRGSGLVKYAPEGNGLDQVKLTRAFCLDVTDSGRKVSKVTFGLAYLTFPWVARRLEHFFGNDPGEPIGCEIQRELRKIWLRGRREDFGELGLRCPYLEGTGISSNFVPINVTLRRG